jgi:hypothetical protein
VLKVEDWAEIRRVHVGVLSDAIIGILGVAQQTGTRGHGFELVS